MEIKDNTVVSLRYVMRNDKNEIVEDSTNHKPIEYLHGSGSILLSLEQSLTGLKPGEIKSFYISENDLPGTFHFNVMIDDVRVADNDEIKAGKPLKGIEKECGPGCCC